MCARPPVRRSPSITAPIAVVSASSGRDSTNAGYSGPPAFAARTSTSGSSACTISSPSNAASSSSAASSCSWTRCGNSSTPEGARKHLNPNTPSSQSVAEVPERVGHGAAPEADVDQCRRRAAAARLTSSAGTSIVGGMELSGMSMKVVTPPAPRRPRSRCGTPPTPCGPARSRARGCRRARAAAPRPAASRTASAGASSSRPTRSMRPSATNTAAGRNAPSTSTRSRGDHEIGHCWLPRIGPRRFNQQRGSGM